MIQFALLLILGSATIVGYGLFALAELAARSLRKAKADARRGNLAARKALHAVVCDGLGLVRARRRIA